VIGLSTTASSSLSSGELLETPPRAPSSPSAASLQLKPEPLAVEMGGKSSSAPLLENNDTGKANGKVPVSLLSKIQKIGYRKKRLYTLCSKNSLNPFSRDPDVSRDRS